MVFLNTLMDPASLAAEIEQGYVTERRHPTLPLAILNYGAKTQHSWHWNDVTEQCRGLIYDTRDGRVVARPFKKFFSADQLRVASIDIPADEPFTAYEKLDGSLGISYFDPDGTMYIATRGSFVSEQAIRANEMLKGYAGAFGIDLDPKVTYLFEILYPQNRVVVDYGGRNALVLLAAIDTETGEENAEAYLDAYFRHGFTGPKTYTFHSYHEAECALEDDERFKGQEGMVLKFASGLRVKLKTSDYLRQHRLVTQVTPKKIWEHISEGRYINALTYGLWSDPAEWIKDHATRLEEWHLEIRAAAAADFYGAKEALGQGFWDRGTFARWVQLHAQSTAHLLFAMYDGKDEATIRAMIWKQLKPKGDRVYRPESA